MHDVLPPVMEQVLLDATPLTIADQGRNEEAEPFLARYVELNPDDAAGHFRLGLVLAALDRIDEANAQMQRATELDPSILEALPTLAP